MADPAVVQWKHNKVSAGGPTSISVTLDSTPTEGNRLILLLGGEIEFSAPSGWSDWTKVDATGFQSLFWHYAQKVAGASESATVTLNVVSGSAVVNTLLVMEVSNGDTPALGTGTGGNGDTSPTVSGQTTTTANSLHIVTVAQALFAEGNSPGAPSGYTFLFSGSENLHMLVAYKVIASAGSTGNVDFNSDNSGTYYTRGMITEVANPTYTQEGFRFRNDDGSETTATWKAAQDTNINIAKDTPFRLRMLTDTSGADPDTEGMLLQYRKSGTPNWIDIK